MNYDENAKQELIESWNSDRYKGVERPYSVEDVLRLRGSVRIQNTLARRGAERFWRQLHTEPHIKALGALTGNQAVQQVKAGLQAIYVSGWQVAADANLGGQMYPDQSLYAANSVPHVVKRINQALQRADQVNHHEGKNDIDFFVPIVADAEAGFGGALNVFELVKGMVESGASAIHLEDQLASEKKCGHMGGKVLIPTSQAVRNLIAARLAMDVMGEPTVLIARTDSLGANLITSDVDSRDHAFITGEKTEEGFYRFNNSIESCIARGLAFAPYADLIWYETADPNLEEAKAFADAIHSKFPGKLLAYNCSPSFNWKKKLNEKDIAEFQDRIGDMGFKFQFVTLAGFHTLNHSMFELAHDYKTRGMAAYSEFQQREFASEPKGYTATRHQREVGAGYFDDVALVVSGGTASTTALSGSTEEEQF